MTTQNLESASNPALAWAKENLNAGVDPEAVVSALIGQGWTELAARQVLDEALSVPVAPVGAPVGAPVRLQAARVAANPRVVGYATARRTEDYRAAASEAHLRNMRNGGILLAVGLAVTVGSFVMGHFMILAWGPIIYGGIRFVSGFFGWIASR
jgi:hypothetical protein